MRPADLVQFPDPARHTGYHVEQAVSDLGFAAQFVIWAMRVQWNHIGDGRQTSLVVARACNAADMPEGATLIAELTDALIAASSRPLSFPCPKWRVLTGDEARLLAFIAAMQARDGTPLMACDAEWRSPRHASAVWAPAQRLALALSVAGFYLASPGVRETTTAIVASQCH
jgi:hypothetical protein